MKFLLEHFAENGKENFSPNDSLILSNLKNIKGILSWQPKFNKFLQSYLLATSNISHFSTKKESVIILKMTNFRRKNLAVFHNVKKNVSKWINYLFLKFIDLFSCNTFVSHYLLTRRFFFKQKVSKPRKTSEKDHSFYNTVSLNKPHTFYEPQLTWHWK